MEDKKIIIGIDEAGRGPVLGPMVVAGVAVEEDKIKELEDLGVKDSKQLTKNQRKKLFQLIGEMGKVKTIIIEPEKLDELMKTKSLNKIELNAFSKIANGFLKEIEGNFEIYVDACSSNAKAFANQLRAKMIDKSPKIIAEHKADEKYPIVSAASIIAKVTRDEIIESYKKEYGEIGSGYPSDPKTINFLKKYVEEFGELPKIARKSWKTAKRILEENKKENKKVKTLLDYIK
ncbi:ribonuclease HII [Methanotorris igneus]|uniref:Ribonuclease HII n=1 Tax=Methanotorris igneus (strain DSM 5666 / JCM 11834 / Kol 5) TaxID=880724 RepID=F6BB41_METIK|nr:ribonuclease HII [Methanotorris igneus]AEF95926.1 ribonuclease HII [Methanotorris igneus Kol 5]